MHQAGAGLGSLFAPPAPFPAFPYLALCPRRLAFVGIITNIPFPLLLAGFSQWEAPRRERGIHPTLAALLGCELAGASFLFRRPWLLSSSDNCSLPFPCRTRGANGSPLLLILGCCTLPYWFPETLTFMKLSSVTPHECAIQSLH